MKLYNFDLSGNCYKVRLLLSLLDVSAEVADVDLLGGEQRGEAFLRINPLGQVPVLETGGVHLRDSQAILSYLARRYGPQWLPTGAEDLARLDAWMSFAANELANGPAALRLIRKFGAPLQPDRPREVARKAFQVLERHLADQPWLVGTEPTVADVACYPYVALAPEGDWPLTDYPAIVAWCRRIETLPRYQALPGGVLV